MAAMAKKRPTVAEILATHGIPKSIKFPFGGYDQYCSLDRVTPSGFAVFKCTLFSREEEIDRYILWAPGERPKPGHEYNDHGHMRPMRPPARSGAKRWIVVADRDRAA